MINAFRIDSHTPAAKHPYRVTVNGKILRNAAKEPRKFQTLAQAIAAGRAAERREPNPLRRRGSFPKGKTPPHLKRYLFKKEHR